MALLTHATAAAKNFHYDGSHLLRGYIILHVLDMTEISLTVHSIGVSSLN